MGLGIRGVSWHMHPQRREIILFSALEIQDGRGCI